MKKVYDYTMMRKTIIIALCLFSCMALQAQEKLKAEVSADFVSSYIWRGLELSKAAVQPALTLSYGGLALELWGDYELVSPGKYKEFDVTLSYTIGKLNLKLADLWSQGQYSTEKRYFYYNAHGSQHQFEAGVGYDFGILSVEWNTLFAGSDGLNKSDKRAYTSYFETVVPFRLAGLDWTGTLGIVPYATTIYGTNGFAVTNVSVRASKDIKVTDTFSIPVFIDVNTNPCLQKAHLVFGFTLRP